VTLEGNKYCITGSSKSFYVNASNGSILDSRPLKQSHESSTLVGLLQNISAKFKKGLVITLKFYLTAIPLTSISFFNGDNWTKLMKVFVKYWTGKHRPILLRMFRPCFQWLLGWELTQCKVTFSEHFQAHHLCCTLIKWEAWRFHPIPVLISLDVTFYLILDGSMAINIVV
jgi:hypothetical protein